MYNNLNVLFFTHSKKRSKKRKESTGGAQYLSLIDIIWYFLYSDVFYYKYVCILLFESLKNKRKEKSIITSLYLLPYYLYFYPPIYICYLSKYIYIYKFVSIYNLSFSNLSIYLVWIVVWM